MNQEKQKKPTYRIASYSSLAAGFNSGLVIDESGQNRELIPTSLAKNLSQCKTFASLHEHSKTLWAKALLREKPALLKYVFEKHFKEQGYITLSPRGCRDMLAEVLKDFVDKQYLISNETFLEWSAKSKKADPLVSSLGLITRNRVNELSESLESYIDNVCNAGRSIEFFVIDDSPEEKTRKLYLEKLKRQHDKYRVPISYAGRKEKEVFATHLKEKGIPQDVIRFALFDDQKFGQTYGINRNALLLQTAGELSLSADDDTRGRIAKSPTYQEGLKIQFEKAYEGWHFADRRAAMDFVSFEGDDLLKVHEKALGKTIGHCVSDIPSLELLDVEHMGAGFTRLIKKGEGQILVTLMGSIGDSGSNSPISQMFARDKERERILTSEEHYRTSLRSRETCKASDKIKIGRIGSMMTMFLGLDNRNCLPPFFPVFRMEDATFGEMIQKSQLDSCVAYLPWVITHCPHEKRLHDGKNISRYIEEPFGPNEAVKVALKSFRPGFSKQGMSFNLKRMAECLIDFGSMPFDEYREILMHQQTAARTQKIIAYESLLKQHKRSPRYWKDDVKALAEVAKKKSTEPVLLAPGYIVKPMGQELAEKLIQKLVFQFGELVKWWPDMVSASKELKAKGIRLARPVNRGQE